jgi:hypothetical protein
MSKRKENESVSQSTVVFVACFLFLAAIARSQTIVRSFDGDAGPGAEVCDAGRTHCGWADMNVGVNGTQVVQVTWQNIRVYDYTGRLLQSTPMEAFIGDAGLEAIPTPRTAAAAAKAPPLKPGPYEPTVAFDEFINRWIVSVTGKSDSLVVSATADALGAWKGVNLSCLRDGPCLNFDPALRLGFDKNGVYYCGAHPGESNPHTLEGVAYDCFAVPSIEVAAIGQGAVPAHINRAHAMPHEVIPVVDHNRNKAPGAPAYFMSKTCDRSVQGGCQNAMHYSFEWIVDSFTWNGPIGTYNEQLVKTGVGSRENKWLFSKPCCGSQASSPQAGNDKVNLRGAESHRFNNAVQFGTRLHGVMSSGPCASDCGDQGTDTNNIALWVEMDCSKPAACVVSQAAKISGPNVNPEFATTGVDAAGNVGITAVSWTPTTNLSILLWTHRVSDPPNTMNGPTIIIAGTQPYTCEPDRTYANVENPAGVITAVEPGDGTKLWVSHQWANSAARCVWNTRIIQYQIVSSTRRIRSPRTGHPSFRKVSR